YQHGPERYEALAPHIPKEARTALDIGSHWGYFAHRLEDHGLQVTAAENSPAYLKFLRRIRDLCGKKFEIFDRSVFELPDPVAFAFLLVLNSCHLVTKTKAAHDQLVEFLGRLDARVIFFQAHNPKEGQMAGAYLNLEPDEFAAFVSNAAGLSTVRRIGGFGK